MSWCKYEGLTSEMITWFLLKCLMLYLTPYLPALQFSFQFLFPKQDNTYTNGVWCNVASLASIVMTVILLREKTTNFDNVPTHFSKFIGFSNQWYEELCDLKPIPTITWTSSCKKSQYLKSNDVIKLIQKMLSFRS